MRHAGARRSRLVVCTAVLVVLLAALAGSARAQTPPRYGGELVFVVPLDPPGYDAHQEETFALIHPAAPHYSTLLRVDPFDRTGTKIIGDLAESWTVSKDFRTYTFKIRPGCASTTARSSPPTT